MLASVIRNKFKNISARIYKIRTMVNDERYRMAHNALQKLMPEIARVDKTLDQMSILNVKPTVIPKKSFKFTKDMIPEMVTVLGGTFMMGGKKDFEGPIREVSVSCFMLGKYEVTNEEYIAYLRGNNFSFPPNHKFMRSNDLIRLFAEPSKPLHPVVNVSWNDAVIYCNWLSEMTGRKFRLPTEAEGEYAARGVKGREYPWEDNLDVSLATFNAKGTSRVDAHPKSASPFGVIDLSGNVYEWRSDWFTYGYNPEDLVDPIGPRMGDKKVLRGGSWISDDPSDLRSAARFRSFPKERNNLTGFRVAEDL